MKKHITKFSFLIIAAIIYASNLSAQTLPFDPTTGLPTGIIEQISVQILPSVPKPGETVNISVENYGANFDKAYFTWRVNGTVITEGRGLKRFTFTAPKSGERSVVSLNVSKEEGGTITRTFTFAPADVEIIQESETYTPPFYKGKALFTSESTARFIAMPDFRGSSGVISPSDLVYTWSINGTVDQANSGYGKRIYRYKSGLIQRNFSVSVVVSARNSELKAKDDLFVSYDQPDLVLYERNPALGIIFEKALIGNFLLSKTEIEIQAIPYNFSTPQRNQSFVDYSWKMNGENIATSNNSFAVFRNDTGESGQAIISLQAEHFNNILQIAQTSMGLIFEENENIFKDNTDF